MPAKSKLKKATATPAVSRTGITQSKKKKALAADVDDSAAEKERAVSIPWSDNPGWISKAVEYLTDNPDFRIKLFSDSTEDATSEGRKKLQGKESKINMYSTMCEYIFTSEVVPLEWQTKYGNEKSRFSKSLQQQFARLKKLYGENVKTLYETGGGLKPEDEQSNLIDPEKIKEGFPHWDDLDAFWRELPNYNPIGVSNATAGINHADKAKSLFRKSITTDPGDTSGVEDEGDTRSYGRSSSPDGKSESPPWDIELGTDDVEVVDTVKKLKPATKSEKDAKARKKDVKGKDVKAGVKHHLDLDALDDLHNQEMVDSARRRNDRLDLETKRTELQLEREKNKRRKLELEAEKLRREEERDKRMFSFMTGLAGTMGGGSHSTAAGQRFGQAGGGGSYNNFPAGSESIASTSTGGLHLPPADDNNNLSNNSFPSYYSNSYN